MNQGEAIVLFAHGSRDGQWAAPFYAIQEAIKQSHPQQTVVLAFLEIGQPDLLGALSALIKGGARRVTIFPLFLGVGKHLRADLPILIQTAQRQHPGVDLKVLPALGEHPQFIAWAAQLATENIQPPTDATGQL